MKKIAWALLLGISTHGRAAPVLNPSEVSSVLKSIDDICGDSWCEGDSNWSFDELQCDSLSGCKLKLTMKPYDFSNNKKLAARPLECELPEFVTAESIVEPGIHGPHYTPELYTAVSECIEDLEAHYGPIYVPVDTACPSLFHSQSSSTAFLSPALSGGSGSRAAIESLSKLIKDQAELDPSCKLERQPYFQDSTNCQKIAGTSEVCTLPARRGSFVVTLDSQQGATVVYIPKQRQNINPTIELLKNSPREVKLPAIEQCATSLLKKSSIIAGEISFTKEISAFSQSHFLAKHAELSTDIRVRALNEIDILVRAHAQVDADDCQYKAEDFDLKKVRCRQQKSTSVCSVDIPNGGFFHVVFDQKNHAQVIFNR